MRYVIIFISACFSLASFSMEKKDAEKSNCSSYFEWLICCSSSKSSERIPMVSYTIQEDDTKKEISKRTQKRNSQEKEKDSTFIAFLSHNK